MSKYGSFNIKGVKEIEKAINEKVSGTKAKRIKRQAVNAGAGAMVKRVERAYRKTEGEHRKGFTADEVMHSDARTKNDIVEAKVGWNGPHDRWRLIHLEEWGYVRSGKQYKPPSYGVLEKVLEESDTAYANAVGRELVKFL